MAGMQTPEVVRCPSPTGGGPYPWRLGSGCVVVLGLVDRPSGAGRGLHTGRCHGGSPWSRSAGERAPRDGGSVRSGWGRSLRRRGSDLVGHGKGITARCEDIFPEEHSGTGEQ